MEAPRWTPLRSVPRRLCLVDHHTDAPERGREPRHLREHPLARARLAPRPVDGEEIPLPPGTVLFEGLARSVTAGTSPYYGYGLKALPDARRRADRFQLRVSTASAVYLLSHLPSLWKGTLRTPDFHDFLVEAVEIEADRPISTQLAGEAMGIRSKVLWTLSSNAVRLLPGAGD
ncbi:MAG: hypothetical protein HC923_12200 [Myxococcales bacterium]|nr:hypothetical protein [Myxococcales bacterium]